MTQPKRVLCIMDLSLAGRASLAVVLPVLAACGVQACPLPAALFSTHTGGFGPVARQDEAAFCHEALAHFHREGIPFDGVYVGYLFGQEQFRLAEAALAQYPSALHLVDPALGDGGKAYTGIDEASIAAMKTLAAKGQMITPNYTESALLLGEDPALSPTPQLVKRRLEALSAGGRSVLITSVPTEAGGFETAGCGPNGSAPFTLVSHQVPCRYPGTGDMMTSALCGLLLGRENLSLHDATQRASAFVEAAAKATFDGGGTPRDGLWFEGFLPMLRPSAC